MAQSWSRTSLRRARARDRPLGAERLPGSGGLVRQVPQDRAAATQRRPVERHPIMPTSINTARKIKNTKTLEPRRARPNNFRHRSPTRVDQLRNSDQWIRSQQFARAFHSYSPNNLSLIMAEGPNASRVAGFRQWQAKGSRFARVRSRSRSSVTRRTRPSAMPAGHPGRAGCALPDPHCVPHQPDRPDRPDDDGGTSGTRD